MDGDPSLETRVAVLEARVDRNEIETEKDITQIRKDFQQSLETLTASTTKIANEISDYRRQYLMGRGAVWLITAIFGVLLFFHEKAAALFSAITKLLGGAP